MPSNPLASHVRPPASTPRRGGVTILRVFCIAAPRASVAAIVPVLIAVISVIAPRFAAAADAAARSPHAGTPPDPAGRWNVAVLLYDGALLLDYGIAAEMFLAADFMRAFNVYTVAAHREVGLSVLGTATVDSTFEQGPRPDVLIVPGGPLWRQAGADPGTVAFLQAVHSNGGILFSVCTGALLLAKAGMLDGHDATTNHQAVEVLRSLAPNATVHADRSYVDDGDVITAAGAGTALPATLHVIERLSGREIAEDLARRYLDYEHEF